MSDRPEIPESSTLRFDEAVKILVEKGMREVEVANAIERAITDSRLRELPWTIMTPSEILDFRRQDREIAARAAAVPTAVKSLLEEMVPSEDNAAADIAQEQLLAEANAPGRFSVAAWQEIFRIGRLNKATGEVAYGMRTVVPLFSRAKILGLFGLELPAQVPLKEREKLRILEDWYANVWFKSWPRPGKPQPSRADDTEAAKKALGDWATQKLIEKVRPKVAPLWTARGRPKKLRNN